jgi:prephenate dehydrogenase
VKLSVGIVGYGRFGHLAARYIARRADVIVCDRLSRPPGRGRGRVSFGSLAVAARQPIVILAVPVSALPALLRKMRGHLQPGALVIDVCAVKTLPLQWLKKTLPRSVAILGTHPLFGPDSDTGTLRGQRIVFCPGRITPGRLRKARRIASRAGLRVQVMSPRAHDRLMAETLLASQYAGRLMIGAGMKVRPWSTGSYEHLRKLVTIAGNDSFGLFRDMIRFNPYGRQVMRALGRSHRAIDRISRRSR